MSSTLRVVAHLTALPGIVADLEVELIEATPKPSTRSGKPGSRPPLALPVVSDLNDAWGIVTTWARDWCETYGSPERPMTGPKVWTWTTLPGWLADHYLTTATNHPAKGEFDSEIDHLHDDDCYGDDGETLVWPHQVGIYYRLRHHLHDAPRSWQGMGKLRCPVDGCGGRLKWNVAQGYIACLACKETWQELEYERLGLILGCEPTPIPLTLAAERSGVPERTLRRWVVEGVLPGQRLGRTWTVDVRDVYAMASREVSG